MGSVNVPPIPQFYTKCIIGKVLDSEFARLAKKRCMPQGEVRRNADFPIEAARLSSALYLVVLSTLGTIAYGWSIHYRVVRRPWGASTACVPCTNCAIACFRSPRFPSHCWLFSHRSLCGMFNLASTDQSINCSY